MKEEATFPFYVATGYCKSPYFEASWRHRARSFDVYNPMCIKLSARVAALPFLDPKTAISPA